MENYLPIERARNVLLRTWLIGTLILFLILIIQTLSGTFEITTDAGVANQAQKVWGWFIPLVFPTLALMFSVVGLSATSKQPIGTSFKKGFYRIVLFLSFLYLIIVALLILLWPMFKYENPLDVFNLSNLFIGPFQGLLVAAIGYLFSNKQ